MSSKLAPRTKAAAKKSGLDLPSSLKILTRKMSGLAAVNGPFVVGYTFCFGLMGVLAVQIFVYFTRFPNDRTSMKAFVTVILLLELTLTVFVFHGFWVATTMGDILEAADTQSVYLYPYLAPLTGLGSLSSQSGLFPSRTFFSMEQIDGQYIGMVVDKRSPFIGTWLVSSLLCDLTITIYMALSLRKSRSQFQSTRSGLVMLTRLTIQTGLITTLAALIELILGMVYYETMYHIAVFYIISKLYANCLLASLNIRLIIRNPSKPYTTVAVWDDSETRLQTKHSQTRESHVMQIIAEVRTDVETDDCSGTSQKKYLGSQAQDVIECSAPAAEQPRGANICQDDNSFV
ncbi:hypothetical protein HYDPIDRAFT_30964 [Hydnomerulius pinastri MD-312]|uniref:DUF6534 domain-containing protein n=1 Tax=Hydnomerulius pinastri MD-312 TaxID=994086 RepID=A0A0C9WCT5_9AGAM|nr:hypothetical protein HYDPIDRAFT_30964 [Hydnomerulius pinastri MD-312]